MSTYDGTDPVLVLRFLTQFVEECDLEGISESQACLILPSFLRGSALDNFRASRGASSHGGLRTWPEYVQYFLATYATASAIREAVNTFKTMRQKATEDELSYASRVNTAAFRCGNAFPLDDKITVFAYGLIPAIRTIVSRQLEQTPPKSRTYERVVQFARDEGEAYRARLPTRGGALTTIDGGEGALEEEDPEEAEQLLALYSKNIGGARPDMVPPPKLAHASSTVSRPGWVDPGATVMLICYQCYAKGHTSRDCQLRLLDMAQVVDNYRKLTVEELDRVPDTNYDFAFKALRCKPVDVPTDVASRYPKKVLDRLAEHKALYATWTAATEVKIGDAVSKN